MLHPETYIRAGMPIVHAQNEAYRPSAIAGYYHRTGMILRLRSQWETSLQSNTACHWLGAILESVMIVPLV